MIMLECYARYSLSACHLFIYATSGAAHMKCA